MSKNYKCLQEDKVKHHDSYPISEKQKHFLQPNKKMEIIVILRIYFNLIQRKEDPQLTSIAENIEFDEAMQVLHKDLMRINLENPNFQ